MKQIWLIILLLTTSSASSFAGMTHLSETQVKAAHLSESQKAANKVWKTFLNCSKSSPLDQKVSQCYKNSFSAEVSELEYHKQLEFLILDFEVSELYDCPSKIKRATVTEKNNFLCFNILGNKSALIGQVYFQEKNGSLKISKLKY